MQGSQPEVICNTGLCTYVKAAYAIKQLLVFLM